MVNPAMNNLLSVFIGGLLAISGSSIVKWLEYLVERRSLRAAFKAEIGGMIAIVERRGHGSMLRDIALAWRNGDEDSELFLFGIEDDFTPVYHANVSRVGLLGSDVAGDVVRFYDLILGVRADLRAQIRGDTRRWPMLRRAELMEHDMEIWSEAMDLGTELLNRL
jgi:hypothetical protein